MTTITATEFKTSFKHFGNMVTKGERLLIKRPQKEPNMVVLNEDDYKEMNRLIAYYKEICDKVSPEANTVSKKHNIIGIAKGKIKYPNDFDEMDAEIEKDFYNDEDLLV